MGRIQAPKRFLEVQQAYKALISADQGLGLRLSHGDGLTNEDIVVKWKLSWEYLSIYIYIWTIMGI